MGSALLAHKATQDELQSRLWTSMPGIVQAFSATAMTADVQIAIQAQVLQPNGTWLDVAVSKCVDCPVIFGGGGGYASTFPLDEGDEGLLVFASRCVDAWWQQGGVQTQAELRMHDLSDGFFVPGCFSQQRVASLSGGASTTEAQLRTLDGTIMARINASSKQAGLVAAASSLVVDGVANKVSITATGGLWVNGVQVTVP
jgi:Phage protein Gp138 N-terminal domain